MVMIQKLNFVWLILYQHLSMMTKMNIEEFGEFYQIKHSQLLTRTTLESAVAILLDLTTTKSPRACRVPWIDVCIYPQT